MSKAIVSALVSCVKCHHVFSPRRFEGHSCKSIGLTGEFKGK